MTTANPIHWAQGLSGAALNIAQTAEPRLRVLAGPGTGKSFAMKRRVARLLMSGQPPRRILAVTFTRNAAAELIDDLHGLSIPGCEKVRASTLHSFCFWLLGQQDVFRHLGRVPRPIVTFSNAGVLQFEGRVLLDDLVTDRKFGTKRDCTKRIRAFEAAWARLQSDNPGWAQSTLDIEFSDRLVEWLKFHRSMLIGELIPEALRFLRTNPSASILSAFDHIIVDEYQDLNRAEQELVKQLCQHSSAAVVGDPNQSIYSFKHANPEGIEQFHLDHPNTFDETLTECYRCPTRVVQIANSLIRVNSGTTHAPLQPLSNNPSGEVYIVQWDNTAEEAEGIKRYVQELIQNRGILPSDILILTPRRQFGYRIRDLLHQSVIPAHSFFHEEALEEESAQRAFSLLNLLSNPNDRVSLRWWLGNGSTSGRSTAYGRLRKHCETSGETPVAALESILNGTLSLPRMNDLISKYQDLKTSLANLSSLPIPSLVDYLFPATDSTLADLRGICLLAINKVQTASELFDHVRTQVTQPEITSGDFVRIMSLHKSKGLTSKVTVVTGCSQGLIPFEAHDADELSPSERLSREQEQRRLFYVGVTRCTQTLVISSFGTLPYRDARQLNVSVIRSGAVGRTIASKFISELGPAAPASRRGADWIATNFK